MARSLTTLAAIAIDEGQRDTALSLLKRSIQEAGEAQDLVEICRAQLRLVSLLADVAGPQASAAIIHDVRRNVIRCGDPQLNAWLHVRFGQVEAKRGILSSAKRHLKVARSLVERDPNLWIEGHIELDLSAVYYVEWNFSQAIEHASAALDCSRRSGHRRTEAAACVNLGLLYGLSGAFDRSDFYLKQGAEKAKLFRNVALAALENRARLSLLRGNRRQCEQFLADVDRSLPNGTGANPSWFSLATDLTRIRLALGTGKCSDAIARALSALEASRVRGDRLLTAELEILLAEGLLMAGRTSEALCELEKTLALDSRLLAPCIAERERVRGCAYEVLGRPALARAHYDRAARIFSGLGHAYAAQQVAREADLTITTMEHEVETGIAEHEILLLVVEGSARLMDVAPRPELLGREALALLERCRAARAAWITQQVGSRPAETLARIGDLPPPVDAGAIEIDLGSIRERRFRLHVSLFDDLDRRAAAFAVGRLAETAVSLETARRTEKERTSLWPADEDDDGTERGLFVGAAMVDVVAQARQVAPTDLALLVTGETGTGKEVLSREVHRRSARAGGRFVPFNCTAVPKDMLESQLFGYRRGAFTGATDSFAGIIRSAAGGTLFLDEIGELGLDVQPKLLRFLDSGEIQPLGEGQPVHVDVRVIAATNRDLPRMVREGQFREDLYYRLGIVSLHLPPLRERREEIPSLLEHYLTRCCRETGRERLRMSDEALEYLLLYSWPGNVRQLANEVRRVVAIAPPGAAVEPALLSPAIRAARKTVPAANPEEPSGHLAVRIDQPLDTAVGELERRMILNALAASGGRVERAARRLGISRKGLFLKRRRFGLAG